ncbi:MAG: rhodanese-like domain-containing protein [Pseudomonadota bacterium]
MTTYDVTATPITTADLRKLFAEIDAGEAHLVDVRKELAYRESGQTVQDARRVLPDNVAAWARSLRPDTKAIVFCVHGHEVSQTAAVTILSHGIYTRYVAGGFEAIAEACPDRIIPQSPDAEAQI